MTSKVKVNTVETESGSTLTLGKSGDTVTLASGASQSGFGRTGTVDWQTGSIKTSGFTAVSGEGYFCNTTSSAFTATLPATPSAGDIVAFKDYAQTFGTNALTVGRNGSNIEGAASDASLDANAESATFVYVDSTKGWVLVNEATTVYGPAYIVATGGTVTTCGDFKIHTFTGPGSFVVCSAGNPAGSDKVSYVVVAGGGGGSGDGGGGGGAGGFREGKCTSDPYSDSPLDAGAGLLVSAQTYPITVGSGGTGGPSSLPHEGTPGGNSVFSTITSTGGGRGGTGGAGCGAGQPGGSGGGGGRATPQAGGTGNTPSVNPAQGTNGSPGGPPNGGDGAGGAGGATVAGSANASPANSGGPGGAGATTSITGSAVAYAGGGGGGTTPAPTGNGGAGGTGGGGAGAGLPAAAVAGTTNTGGGGGGSSGGPVNLVGAAGGSGIVIIRYKFQ